MATGSLTAHPGKYLEGDYSFVRISNATNPVGKGANNTTYAQITLETGTSAETWVYWPFDLSAIPSNATIDSVSCSAKAAVSVETSSYIKYRTIRLYSGTTGKGSATNLTTSETAHNLDCGTWTRAELQDCRLRMYARNGLPSTSTNRYLYFYGADLTVTYTYNSEKFMLKTGGSWADASRVFEKVSGIWVEQTDLANVIEDGVRYKNGGEIESTGPKAIPVTITGTGSAKYCFATINGTEYASAASGIEVMPGDTVRFTVWGEPPATYVTINGTKVQTGSMLNATSYDWTIPDGVSSISIELYDDGSTTAQITVTAQ